MSEELQIDAPKRCPRCGGRLEFSNPALCFGLYRGQPCGWSDWDIRKARNVAPEHTWRTPQPTPAAQLPPPPPERDGKAAAAGDLDSDEDWSYDDD